MEYKCEYIECSCLIETLDESTNKIIEILDGLSGNANNKWNCITYNNYYNVVW